MNRTLALASAALALAACSPDFDPASKVDRLRVLAIQAEPPEIEPAGATTVAPDRATLRSLVLRADFDAEHAQTTTVVYLACVPDPRDLSPSPCVMLAALRDPTVMLAQAAQEMCAAGGIDPANVSTVAFAGVEACEARRMAPTCGPATVGAMAFPAPEIAVPSDFGSRFKALRAVRPDAPELILGVQAVVLAFALDARPDELVAGTGTTCPIADMAARFADLWASRDHVLSTKRVQIRGPDAPDLPNDNPIINGIVANGTILLDPGPTTVAAGTIALTPQPEDTDALRQTYTKLDAAGIPIESTREDWVYSWFSTAGEIDELHTRGATPDEWRVFGPGGSLAVVAAVVRDLRGGVAWKVREVTIAP